MLPAEGGVGVRSLGYIGGTTSFRENVLNFIYVLADMFLLFFKLFGHIKLFNFNFNTDKLSYMNKQDLFVICDKESIVCIHYFTVHKLSLPGAVLEIWFLWMGGKWFCNTNSYAAIFKKRMAKPLSISVY